MGGNALKNAVTRRFTKREFVQMESLVYVSLFKNYNVKRHATIPYVREKLDFGDLDVLYCTRDNEPMSVEDVTCIFPETKEIIRNGPCISLEVNQLQVDLIHVKRDEYLYALDYFSYNDLGNLIGKIFHKFGLKHGHRGLTLPIRLDNNMLDEVMVTNDHTLALEFIGLDSRKFGNGFDTFNEMFDYVTKSKYFNPAYYDFEHMNNVDRTRDKKRKTYNAFLKHIENLEKQAYTPRSDKTVHLETIFKYFPDALPKYEAVVREYAFTSMAKQKFNGDIVSKLTGASGKELGELMQYLRKDFAFSKSSVILTPNIILESRIKEHYDTFSRSNQ